MTLREMLDAAKYKPNTPGYMKAVSRASLTLLACADDFLALYEAEDPEPADRHSTEWLAWRGRQDIRERLRPIVEGTPAGPGSESGQGTP